MKKWNGLSPTRHDRQTFKAPDAHDWDTITNELIATQEFIANASTFRNPMINRGDLIIGDHNGRSLRLPLGKEGQVLKIVKGMPTWVDP